MALSNNSYIIKEWAPLTDLLNKIPSKPNLSIFSEEVKITCVDVLAEFIALGTNYGMAYWYDRKKKELQRLRCENSQVPITAIKVLSTVDYMLACGGKNGNISIFQIPKTHPEWIPENLKPKNKSVERYVVSDLHKSHITALEWSKNGMKLFSGDKNGTIVMTEMDFYMHICKSLEILNESYEVVQLSYSKPYLVISTTYRSIICEKTDKWNVAQVGQKDRKILGTFGGIIQPDKLKNRNAVIYCTRPGLRFWVSDCKGNVQKTLLFKELLNQDCLEVPLLNPVTKKIQTCSKDINFGVLKPFCENLLVTYNSTEVYILDPNSMTVVSKINHLRSVLDVACYKDEIFILEEDRNLIRISTKPEINHELNNMSSMESSYFTSSIRDITSKLQTANILSAIPPVIEQAITYNINEHTDGEMVVNAEEAVECRNEKLKDLNISKFENIKPEDESKEIIYKHKKYRKKQKTRSNIISHSSQSSNSSSDDIANLTRPTVMDMSFVGVLPDLRSPQSIQNDIDHKEKLLFDSKLFKDRDVQSVINEEQNLNVGGCKSKLNFNCDNTSDFLKSNVLAKDEIRIMKKELSLNVVCDKSSDMSIVDDKLTRLEEHSEVGGTKKDSIDGVVCTSSTKIVTGGIRSRITRRKTNDQVSSKPIPIVSNSTDPPECVNIPIEWNLSSIRLHSESTSPSENDWELI